MPLLIPIFPQRQQFCTVHKCWINRHPFSFSSSPFVMLSSQSCWLPYINYSITLIILLPFALFWQNYYLYLTIVKKFQIPILKWLCQLFKWNGVTISYVSFHIDLFLYVNMALLSFGAAFCHYVQFLINKVTNFL